jgi:ribosome-binding protein aMBF1 (putative translation factor)|tara:strand:+ start:2298 stop:2594 length:297 start_codon:yes stop_codon:yes gene_type:complete
MTYAVGKKSLGLCDRCGQQYPYLSLRKEWTNLKVCPECFETKQPQLEPTPPASEPQALYDPRPARKEPMVVLVAQNVFNVSASIHGTTQLGTIKVNTS